MKEITDIKKVSIHYSRPLFSTLETVSEAQNAQEIFRSCITTEQIDVKEFFWVMLTTTSNHVLGVSLIGCGSAQGVCVNIKEIFQLALNTNASCILLCHNHPSGNLKPSEADMHLTHKVKDFGKMIGIELLDHIIITSESYYSFANNGNI